MNRIILIGNGFDLAHNLKTGYDSFLSNLWAGIINNFNLARKENKKHYDDDFLTISHINKIQNEPEFEITTYSDLFEFCEDNNKTIDFKNNFLKIITNKYLLKSWGGIENEYFELLKKLALDPHFSIDEVIKLNNDFERIKQELHDYIKGEMNRFDLQSITNNGLLNKIQEKIYSGFEIRDFNQLGLNYLIEEEISKILNNNQLNPEPNANTLTFKNVYLQNLHILKIQRRNDLTSSMSNKYNNTNSDNLKHELKAKLFEKPVSDYILPQPTEILFLNFNYTNLDKYYTDSSFYNSFPKTIHIHGEVNNQDNPIIFGYGDEKGKDYLSIEEMNINECLVNVKSVRYQDTDNYKNLLQFINLEKYQIFIFGHSCSNSDRTLLSTLFEHENCVSIKPFYYRNINSDNYSDLIKNISRNFLNKGEMRDKVVNKQYCQFLVD